MKLISIAISIVLVLSSVTLPEELHVYPAGSGTDYTDISEAIRAAEPGDTVLVHQGVYPGPILFEKSGNRLYPITLKSYGTDSVTITGKHLSDTPSTWGREDLALLEMRGEHLVVSGMKFSDFTAEAFGYQPIGIRVHGGSSHIRIQHCEVSDIGSKAPVDEEGNGRDAHGILVEGSGAEPTDHVIVSRCCLKNLTLGSSEALVVNGNVSSFWIEDNCIHDCDNIGIDCIGYEKEASKSYDRARVGWVKNNRVYRISSWGNPAYRKDGQPDEYERAAAGIYVDGGRTIVISGNRVWDSDYGIEVASERYLGNATQIGVFSNKIYNNSLAGITVGGSDLDNGGANHCVFRGNTIVDNDRSNYSSGQIQLQCRVKRTLFQENTLRRTMEGGEGTFICHYYDVPIDALFIGNRYLHSQGEDEAWKIRDQDYDWESFQSLGISKGEVRDETTGPSELDDLRATHPESESCSSGLPGGKSR